MRLRDVTDLLLLAALWGGSFLFMRIGAPQFGAIPMAGLRTGIAALVLVGVMLWRGKIRELGIAPWRLFTTGLVSSAIPFVCFGFAALSLKAGFSAILNATAPFWGALVAFAWLGDRLTKLRVAGLAVGFAGVVVLVWGKLSFGSGGAGPAIIAVLLATLCYGIAVNYAKRYLAGIGSLASATGSQIGAAVAMAPLLLASWPAVMPDLTAWLAVIAMAVLCTAIAYLLYFRLILRVGATRTIAVTFLIPIFGMFWGWIFLAEAVTWNMAAGTVVILLGTALTTGLIGARTTPA
ncbi:MAG: DMT family transporter [Burkholderiales bacterium]|nr:DMT family transporter [Burkholderiales bacterium]